MEAHQQRRRRILQEKEPRRRASHCLILPAIPNGEGDSDLEKTKGKKYSS